MKHWTGISEFVAVAELQSFTKAAKQLGISVAQVSRNIAELEASLAIKLLYRSTRSVSLTEEGLLYLQHCKHLVASLDEANRTLANLKATPRGQIKLTAPVFYGETRIAPLLHNFLQQYPDTELDLQLSNSKLDLVQGGFDLAIRIGELPDSSLIARKIAPCLSVICASPAYLAQHGLPMTPSELTQHNCLFYSYFQDGVEWSFHSPDGVQRVQPKGNYQVNNSDAIHQACLDGLGIANLPHFIIEPALQTGHLQALLTDYPLPEHGIYAVYPQRKYQPTKVTVLIEFLMEKLGKY